MKAELNTYIITILSLYKISLTHSTETHSTLYTVKNGSKGPEGPTFASPLAQYLTTYRCT